jgi:hypothetical protein
MPPEVGAEDRGADITVRAYRAADREVVRDICCRTAFRNLGARGMLDDRELFGDYWMSYYTDYEPESIFVAERQGQVIAYLTGCTSTRRHIRIMATRIVPRVLARLGWRATLGRYRDQPRAGAFFRWLALRSWREAAPVDIDKYPAQYHANVLREGYGRGVYSKLVLRFFDTLGARGVAHVHSQATERKQGGPWQRLLDDFQRRHPDVPIARWERDSSLGRAVLGLDRDLANRAWGVRLDHGQLVLQWFARYHGL